MTRAWPRGLSVRMAALFCAGARGDHYAAGGVEYMRSFIEILMK